MGIMSEGERKEVDDELRKAICVEVNDIIIIPCRISL